MEEHFRQSNLIEGIDDPLFDNQLKLAWEYLEQSDKTLETLTHKEICDVQRIITELQDDLSPTERGWYRKVPVWIGGEKLINHGLIAPLMHNWLFELHELTPMAAHIRFEKIHPFIDGNGRTGRMLLWWHEKKLGQEPSLIMNDTKYEEYYPIFER